MEIIDEPVVAFKSQAPKPSAASAPAAVYNLDTDSEAAEPVSSAPNVRKAAGGTIESSSSPAQPRPRFTYNFQPIVEDILSRKKAVSDDEDDFDGSSPPKKKRAPAKPRAKEKSTDESSDEEPAPKPRKRAPKDPARAAAQEAEKARKAAERERKKAKREEQKREDQARKEEVKRVRQVNRVMNKKEASKDMIVDVDVGIVNKPGGGALLENLRLQDCQVSVQSHPIPDTILWRRRTRALWDGEKDAWIPLDEERIIPENFMVIIMAAEEFGRRIRANSISTHLAEIRSTFSGRSVILLVTGLRDYRRRLDSKTSSGYREGVLQQVYGVAGNAANQQQQRGATVIIGGQVVSVADLPPKAEVDQELMRLQIMEKIRIIEAEDNEEAIDFMIGLTTEIAMIPFKAIRENLLDFCPDGKLRKSGTDGADTWQWMLRQIHMLEENSANAVVKEYPTLNSLFQAYSRCTSKGQAERLLEDIVVQRHGKAGETNRRLGPALSKRIYNVIMGEDPEESAR